jgi:hypothetical protein
VMQYLGGTALGGTLSVALALNAYQPDSSSTVSLNSVKLPVRCKYGSATPLRVSCRSPSKCSKLSHAGLMNLRSKAYLTSGLSSSNPGIATVLCQPSHTKHSSWGRSLT